jgi:hypothetical protein
MLIISTSYVPGVSIVLIGDKLQLVENLLYFSGWKTNINMKITFHEYFLTLFSI